MGEAPQGGAPAGAVVGRAAAVDLFVDGADGATTMTMAMGDDDDDESDKIFCPRLPTVMLYHVKLNLAEKLLHALIIMVRYSG